MRPRIPEEVVDRIDEHLERAGHENRSRFVEFAVKRYLDELDRRAEAELRART